MSELNSARRLLALLPAIYREDSFLGQYLWAFERVLLTGMDGTDGLGPFEGLEQVIDRIPTLFDPMTTEAGFLPWLSSWMAFPLRADLDEDHQRHFLAQVISLYRQRGTSENLRTLLGIFTGGAPTITEGTADSGEDGPHAFHVVLTLNGTSTTEHLRDIAISRALIELEKPAHTTYTLGFIFPSMKVGITSTVGVDTLIGTL
jgi:phage tail-like protein